MDSEIKKLIENTTAGFIANLLILFMICIVALIVGSAFINETVDTAKEIIVYEFSTMSVNCSEVYTKDSMVLTLNGVPQYCTISKRTNYDANTFIVELK